MGQHEPIAVKETTAASMMDLSLAKFQHLVSVGAFPQPVRLADGVERWRVSDLHAILDGSAAIPINEDIEI